MAQGQAGSPPAAPKGPQYLNFPGKSDKLVVLGERPLVAETPEHLLDDDTTPTDKFFVRNNGMIPEAAKEPGGLEDRRSTARSTRSSSSRSPSSRPSSGR